MKHCFTVEEWAALRGKSRRQAYRILLQDKVIEPKGRRVQHRIPLTRLLAVYGEELESLALVQRLTD